MHICHFISSRGLGRGEFYIDLVNEMIKDDNIKITLLIPKDAKFLDRVEKSINIIEYSSKDSRNNPFLYLELFKIFKNNSFDLVHTHFAKSSEIFYRLNKLFNIKHIATKHNPRKGKIFNKLENVTAVSGDVVESIDNKNVKLIFNGLTPQKMDTSSKYPHEPFIISTIGRLEKVKGYDKLIKSLADVKNDFILNIIGDGQEYKALESLIQEYNLENKVNLVGYKENIPEILASSDLCVISSLSEGFSIVAIEALYYANLLISTKVGICKVILNETLLIDNFEFSEKIDDIITNYSKYEEEFQRVKQTYQEKFLLCNVAKEYIEYYKEILK